MPGGEIMPFLILYRETPEGGVLAWTDKLFPTVEEAVIHLENFHARNPSLRELHRNLGTTFYIQPFDPAETINMRES
jgi:hypothetical protein